MINLRSQPNIRHIYDNVKDRKLTPREIQIAKLVAEGLTNKTIARLFHISLQTVKNHVTTIYIKTGTRNRVQLARSIDELSNV